MSDDMNDQAVMDFLSGGGGAPDAFKRINRQTPVPSGTVVAGIIQSWKLKQQVEYEDDTKLKFWPNGDKMMELVVTVQTDLREARYEDDDGMRRFFVKGRMQAALRDALINAKVKNIARGGKLTVRFDGYDEPTDPKYDGAKMYTVWYSEPAAEFLAAPEPEPEPAPAAAPAPTVQQAQDAAIAAAQANLAAAGMTSAPPAAAPAATSTAPAQPPAAAPAGVDPALAAALANLTPEQRAAMGLPA